MPKRPKPVRLTKARAMALLAVADRGMDNLREEIHDALESTDLEVQRGAQHLDEQGAEAMDAIEIIRNRYVQITGKKEPETLF